MYSGRTSSSDHFSPILIVQNLLRAPLLGFEVRGDVIFSKSEGDCPVIPHPHCMAIRKNGLERDQPPALTIFYPVSVGINLPKCSIVAPPISKVQFSM